MGLPSIIKDYLASFIGIVGILVLIYWLIFISYRLYLILCERKKYFNSPELDPRIHTQNLYSFTTVRNRDICLVVLILLDIIITVNFAFVLPNIHHYSRETDQVIKKGIFSNCTRLNSWIAYAYTQPASASLFTTLFVFVFTQIMLISFLNTYLAGRYFGHSLPRKVIYKYIFVWGFQCVLHTICIIPKLLILLCPISTLLLFLNWLNLIASSRKVCRAVRSKMKEIRLFEWNPAQYRNLVISLKHYEIANAFLITAHFFLFFALLFLTISFFLNIFVADCYFTVAYGINFNIVSSITIIEGINDNIKELGGWVGYFITFSFAIFLLLPSLFLSLSHLLNSLYHRCTGKGNINTVNRMLFEPLITH